MLDYCLLFRYLFGSFASCNISASDFIQFRMTKDKSFEIQAHVTMEQKIHSIAVKLEEKIRDEDKNEHSAVTKIRPVWR